MPRSVPPLIASSPEPSTAMNSSTTSAAAAMSHEAVVKFVAGQAPKKVVVVPGRLVNVVV